MRPDLRKNLVEFRILAKAIEQWIALDKPEFRPASVHGQDLPRYESGFIAQKKNYSLIRV